jgi:hypothetical protein
LRAFQKQPFQLRHIANAVHDIVSSARILIPQGPRHNKSDLKNTVASRPAGVESDSGLLGFSFVFAQSHAMNGMFLRSASLKHQKSSLLLATVFFKALSRESILTSPKPGFQFLSFTIIGPHHCHSVAEPETLTEGGEF